MTREEAIKEIRSWDFLNEKEREAVETLIPELKESEDEMVREEILEVAKTVVLRDGTLYGKKYNCREWIAWLEKQGNTNKEYWRGYREGKKEILDKYSELKKQMKTPEESLGISSEEWNEIVDECVYGEQPRFNIGDWIVSDLEDVNEDFRLCKIIGIEDGCYTIQSANGCKGYNFFETWESDYHLWSIKDAKDGDVLVTVDDKRPFIHKGCLDPNHPDSPVVYCGINSEGYFCRGGNKFDHWWTSKEVHPATKEQRDLLFQEMKELGYGWDAEKKELLLISEDLTDFEKAFQGMCCDKNKSFIKECCKTLLALAKKQLQPKWDEHDEYTLIRIKGFIQDLRLDLDKELQIRLLNWLDDHYNQSNFKPTTKL